jgi:NAD(P)-dependent dehydrogenase (short-subunit alcohol dehydrogenase family)
MSSTTLCWVTGGTSGLGAALVRSVPYEGARVVNVARHRVDGLDGVDNLVTDLGQPAGWEALRQHLRDELARFTGDFALFVHNAAALTSGAGYAGTVDPMEHERHVLLNSAAPIVVGEAFLAAVPDGLPAGLVMVSSTASTSLPVTRAAYGAGKAGLEQWVRVVRQERRERGTGPWVVAVLPGSVDTPGLRAAAATDEAVYPRAKVLRESLERGLVHSPEHVAAAIWAALPPADDGPDVIRVASSIAAATAESERR